MISLLKACLFVPNGKENVQNCFPMITEVLSLKASVAFLGLVIQHRDCGVHLIVEKRYPFVFQKQVNDLGLPVLITRRKTIFLAVPS